MGDVTLNVDDQYVEFWDRVDAVRWEPATIEALRSILVGGTRYLDLGAWIGPTALFAAACGAEVLAYEPDPVALPVLRDNIARNPSLQPRIVVKPFALGRVSGSAVLAGGNVSLGQSESRLVRGSHVTSSSQAVVQVVDARAEASRHFGGCEVLKVDVEGGEFILISRIRPFLRRNRPVLILSIHGYQLLAKFQRFGLLAGVLQRGLSAAMRAKLLFWDLSGYRYLYLLGRELGTEDTHKNWRRLSTLSRAKLLLYMREVEIIATQVRMP